VLPWWQVNYVSHALLTELLLPLLKASKPSRVVHVSSEVHHNGASPDPGADITAANWTGLQGAVIYCT
jgi:NAD(P)-dependent dehydrogenase (short-subunit alcohol dehydrogenase family)